MNKFRTCKIGLGQSHTECISPQALGFFVFTTRTCVFCSQSVAFSAGQSRGILWDSFTTYRCGVKELTQTRAQPWANSALCSLSVGWLQLTRSKDGHTTGLARCTRRWLQKYSSIDLSGSDTSSPMLSSRICCVNMFSSCGLLLAPTQSWWYSATENFDGTQSFGSLGSLFFSLDLHKRLRMKFKCGQKIGKGSYVPILKEAGCDWLYLTLGDRKFPSNFTVMNFSVFFFPPCNIEVEVLNEL